MKITKQQLRQIIREELSRVLTEAYPGQEGNDPHVDCPDDYREDQLNRSIFGDEIVQCVGSYVMVPGMPVCVITQKANDILRPYQAKAMHAPYEEKQAIINRILSQAGC